MSKHNYDTISTNPLYLKISATRKKLVWPLSLIVLISYFTFILSLAFYPSYLAQPIEGGVTSIGILFGFMLIILTFVVTGIYSYVANRTIEPMLEQLRTEFTGDDK